MTNRQITMTIPKRITFFLLGLILLFVSCNGPIVYSRYQGIQGRSWDKEDEYFFTFDITETNIPYDISLEIRNNNLYPFQNLWVFWGQEQPSGTITKDTLECVLADDYGKWLGKGISLFETSFPLKSAYTFPESGSYTIALRHGMRKENLPGIESIGIRIQKTTP